MNKKQVQHRVLWEECSHKQTGTVIVVFFNNSRFSVQSVLWNAKSESGCMLYGDRVGSWDFDKDNTLKLMRTFGTFTGFKLLNAVYERFHEDGVNSIVQLMRFCRENGIKCVYNPN